jgi:sugar fermentation stimulation protein A
MIYPRVQWAVFIRRPNRFIADCKADGEMLRCHVNNTGRCRELLVSGHQVVLAAAANPGRQTAWDLIAVQKGDLLINIDSQAPNKVVWEFFPQIVGPCTLVRPEYRLGDSRFDFYAEKGRKRVLAEVKGVTLEDRGTVYFPDAPTVRGLKHVTELTELAGHGYECWVILLVQMEKATHFEPNDRTMPAFGMALNAAVRAGVHVVAYTCRTAPDRLALGTPLPVVFHSYS